MDKKYIFHSSLSALIALFYPPAVKKKILLSVSKVVFFVVIFIFRIYTDNAS